MNLIKKNFTIAIIPLFIVAWGIFMLLFFGPYYSNSSDPEYPYLVNGLNCSTLHFNRIGHFDHPGTPLQVYNGVVIRISHLVSGKGNINQDVFNRPEHYLDAITISLFLVHSILVLGIGIIGVKKKIPLWQIAILQASCFYNEVLVWLFSRVNPDRFLMIVFSFFIFIYLKHGFENRSFKKFAFWSGVAMALGFATKFNFLPLLILPILIIDSNKNRLIYVVSVIISFFIFVAPIINKLKHFSEFITNILFHGGAHGKGDVMIFNPQMMMDNFSMLFRINPGLYLILAALILLFTVAICTKNKEGFKKYSLLFLGFLIIILVQMLMVSKHFVDYYLVPMFSIYGFIFFSISLFLSKFLNNKNLTILFSSILPFLFIILTLLKVNDDVKIISKIEDQHEKIRTFVDKKIPKGDFWFVEPTWESGPYVENALVYGITYSYHDNYLSQLMVVNPNIITYEGNKDQVKLWRTIPVTLDSIVATGKNIYLYSTPGRNAMVLTQMLQEAASRNSIQLQIDTLYNDNENKIIRAKGINIKSIW